MTVVTLEKDATEDVQRLGEYAATLSETAEDLRNIMQRIRAGELDGVKDANRILGDMRAIWRQARAMEADVEKEQNRVSKRCGYELDLQCARNAIGCKLDRLRTARRAEGVS